jgi:hypothetical protein
MSPDEEVVYDFVTDLTTKHAVSDELFDRAKRLLGDCRQTCSVLHATQSFQWPRPLFLQLRNTMI